jgi:uncharacterized membrane protein YoaK (UPF0700 family)
MTNRLKALREGFLMILTVSSGAADAICFLAFGKVFAAFMTGNLVFLGIGAVGGFPPTGPNIPRVAITLGAFALGVFVATFILRLARRSRVAAHGMSWSLWAILLTQVAFTVGWMAVSGHPSFAFATVLIAIEAVAMGMQSGAVAALGVKAVFTTAATATFINIAREAADRRVSDTSPARMARILVSLIAGAAAGAALLVNARIYAPLVPAVAVGLGLIMHEAARRVARESAPSATARLRIASGEGEPLVETNVELGYDEAA